MSNNINDECIHAAFDNNRNKEEFITIFKKTTRDGASSVRKICRKCGETLYPSKRTQTTMGIIRAITISLACAISVHITNNIDILPILRIILFVLAWAVSYTIEHGFCALILLKSSWHTAEWKCANERYEDVVVRWYTCAENRTFWLIILAVFIVCLNI